MRNRLAAITLISAVSSLPSGTRAAPPGESGDWKIRATLAEESVGQGLPVLALDHPDWPNYLVGQSENSRAFRSIKAELSATHPTGWSVAVVERAEVWLHANADAVTLAAYDARGTDPEVARGYAPYAKTQSWQGEAIQVGTPWWNLDSAELWQWRAEITLLQLKQLRTAELSGDLQYRGGGAYDFDLRSQRANTDITSLFLAPSGTSGTGESLSFALQGQPVPGWRIQLRGDDLASQLRWSDMATDTNALNSQITSRAPDGSLDYAPLLRGKKALMPVTSQIGAYWQACVAWSAFESSAVTLRATRKAEISQIWLGWNRGDGAGKAPRWSLEFEPNWQATKLELTWGGSWQLLLATDGLGQSTQYRQLKLGWQAKF